MFDEVFIKNKMFNWNVECLNRFLEKNKEN